MSVYATSLRSLTVFVKSVGPVFVADSIRTSAIGTTPDIAARRAAARFFGCAESDIELTHEYDNVIVARLRDREPPRRSMPRWHIPVIIAIFAVVFGIWLVGGAR